MAAAGLATPSRMMTRLPTAFRNRREHRRLFTTKPVAHGRGRVWAEQLTLNKTPRFTGPVNRASDFLSTGGSAPGGLTQVPVPAATTSTIDVDHGLALGTQRWKRI
jgi:hypothetical protein